MIREISLKTQRIILIAGLSAAFLATSPHPPAEARVNGPRETEWAQDCGALQDTYDQLYAEVHNPATTPERRAEILRTMENIGIVWDSWCGPFGKISSFQVLGDSNPNAIKMGSPKGIRERSR